MYHSYSLCSSQKKISHGVRMAALKPPGSLSFEGNVAHKWKSWIKAFELYETATELENWTRPKLS